MIAQNNKHSTDYRLQSHCTELVHTVVTVHTKTMVDSIYSKEQKYIDAFEMWCYRRLLRISWTQHKTNEWILRELEVERELDQNCWAGAG